MKKSNLLFVLLLVAIIVVGGSVWQTAEAVTEMVKIDSPIASTAYPAILSTQNTVTVSDPNSQKVTFDFTDYERVQFVVMWSEKNGGLMTIGKDLYAFAENSADKKFLALNIEKDKLTQVEQGSDGSIIIKENGNVVNTVKESDVNTNDRAAMIASLLGFVGQKAGIVTYESSKACGEDMADPNVRASPCSKQSSPAASGLSGAVVKKVVGLTGGLTGFQVVKDTTTVTKKKSAIICVSRPVITVNQKKVISEFAGAGPQDNCGGWCVFSCGHFPGIIKCHTCSGGTIFGSCKSP